MVPEPAWLQDVGSTMELAHEAAALGAVHGTSFIARRQLSGRGTRGKVWESGPGGLWLSVVARPVRVDGVEALSLRVGLALAAHLEQRCPSLPAVEIKWPNDLLITGRKVAGILCEARWSGTTCQWVVIGVGLNVTNDIPEQLEGVAARLDEWAPGVLSTEIAAGVIAAIAATSLDAPPLSEGDLAAFARRDALMGRRVVAPVEGVAEGITAAGALRVRLDSGPVREVLGGVASLPV